MKAQPHQEISDLEPADINTGRLGVRGFVFGGCKLAWTTVELHSSLPAPRGRPRKPSGAPRGVKPLCLGKSSVQIGPAGPAAGKQLPTGFKHNQIRRTRLQIQVQERGWACSYKRGHTSAHWWSGEGSRAATGLGVGP